MKILTFLFASSVFLVACNNHGSNTVNNAEQKTTIMSDTTPKVTGVGGVFFKVKDPQATKTWYGENLGLAISDFGSAFEFRNANRPDEINYLSWSPFDEKTDYFHRPSLKFL